MDFLLMIIFVGNCTASRCRILRELDLLTDSHCPCLSCTHIRNCVCSIGWYLPTYNAHCAIYVILCTQLLLLGISTATLPHSCRPDDGDECRGLINVRVLRSINSSIHNNILSLVVSSSCGLFRFRSDRQTNQPTDRLTDW